MAISDKTAEAILRVLRKYGDDRVLLSIFTELRRTQGSVSFHDTLSKLIMMVRGGGPTLPPPRKRKRRVRDDRLGSINHMPDRK